MVGLKPCKLCGGEAEIYKMWIGTVRGDRPCIGYRCSKCHARTYLYQTDIDGTYDKEMLELIARLWNKGCISIFYWGEEDGK